MSENIESVFKKESKILKNSQDILEKGNIPYKILLSEYANLVKNYKKLLITSKTTTKIGDSQQKKLNTIKKRLSKYVSYQLFKKITQGKEKVELKTKRKKLTVFFSDIKDFSYISSHMEGEELALFLNSYLEEMTKIVIKYGGNLDKYLGDAILVFFGDLKSDSDEENAFRCLSMALEMRDKMKVLQKMWYEKGYQEPLHIRIGIATGFCAVGNFGSTERMDYTIIGNPVNYAARLESAAEPDEILISHETWGLIKDKIVCEPSVSLSLKGFHHELIAHKVLALKKEQKEQFLKIDDPEKGIKIDLDFSKMNEKTALDVIEKIRNYTCS